MSNLLTLPAVAARLGTTWAVAYNRALAGAFGPLERINGRYAISVEGVEAFEKRERET